MKTDLSLADFTTGLTDLLLPRRCLVCGSVLALHEKHLCINCLADLPRTGFSNLSHNQMADRFNSMVQEGEYCFATALFFYRASTGYRKITQSLKYGFDIKAGRYFSGRLGKEMASSILYRDVDAVIPVPLHWTRKWTRGYNQAEVIAGELAVSLDARLRNDILFRVRRTRSQATLAVGDKGRNVEDAFRVRRNRIRDVASYSHILLVDDVSRQVRPCIPATPPCALAPPPGSPSPPSPPSKAPPPRLPGRACLPRLLRLPLRTRLPRRARLPCRVRLLSSLSCEQNRPKLYSTGAWRSLLRTNGPEYVLNWRLEISLANKTGRICTQPEPGDLT